MTPRYFHVARHLLRDLEEVHIHNLDSRVLLKQLAADDALRTVCTFFYLDAHWYGDLPLAEELEVIASTWSEWVALVDDFQVPGDDGYGFDDYGEGKSLTLDYIGPLLGRHALPAFFPAEPSGVETGARRGSLVTCATALTAKVAQSPALLKYELRQG